MEAFAPELIIGVVIVVAVPMLVSQIRSLVVWAVELKRAGGTRATVGISDISRQLEVLQQSVDAMAIEVERISEVQRAETRLRLDVPLQGDLPKPDNWVRSVTKRGGP